jgi:hypothetical protein
MTQDQQQAWDRLVEVTRQRQAAAQDIIARRQRDLDNALAANKPGRSRQAARWLATAQDQATEIAAILAVDAELTRFRGQEG